MIRRLIVRRLNKEAKKLGESLDYCRSNFPRPGIACVRALLAAPARSQE
jgi:hypothetical protein